MGTTIGAGVTLEGLYDEDSAFTFNVTSTNGTPDRTTSPGLAVSLDPSAANSVQLAATGLPVLGALGSYEPRGLEGIAVGAVFLKGAFRFPFTGTLAIGNSVVGSATPGSVKQGPNTGAFDGRTLVTEIDNASGTAVVLIV